MGHPATADGLAGGRSFDALHTVRRWTARLALELLPETNQPKVEVIDGSVIVSPHANWQHQRIERELVYRLNRAARVTGLEVVAEANVVSGEDLFIPDIVVAPRPSGSPASVDIEATVLLGEITSPGNRNKDVIDRRREYASAGVEWFLLVDLRHQGVSLTLHRLTDGAYREVSQAGIGQTFAMTEPFAFEVDPAELLDS